MVSAHLLSRCRTKAGQGPAGSSTHVNTVRALCSYPWVGLRAEVRSFPGFCCLCCVDDELALFVRSRTFCGGRRKPATSTSTPTVPSPFLSVVRFLSCCVRFSTFRLMHVAGFDETTVTSPGHHQQHQHHQHREPSYYEILIAFLLDGNNYRAGLLPSHANTHATHTSHTHARTYSRQVHVRLRNAAGHRM